MRKLTILFALLTLGAGLAQAQENPEPNTLPTPASNQIVYRSSDHQKITPNEIDVFGATYIDDQNVYYAEADYGVITFDGDVTSVGDWAFPSKTTLTAIVLPSTVISIGMGAFENCKNLSSIDFQEGVTSIGEDAFKGCTNLSFIVLQEGVTSIGGSAFGGCTSIAELTIPSTVTSIGAHAFSGCANLSSVDLQEGGG